MTDLEQKAIELLTQCGRRLAMTDGMINRGLAREVARFVCQAKAEPFVIGAGAGGATMTACTKPDTNHPVAQ